MQISTVNYCEVASSSHSFRLDADFFRADYRKIQKILGKETPKTLGDYNISILHPNEIKRNYTDDGVLFLRAQNVRPLYINMQSNPVFISREDAEHLHKNKVQYKDVLLTRTGANFGQCAIYLEKETCIASSHTFVIKSGDLNPFFLAVFMNTKFGRKMIDRGMYGGSQPEVAPYFLYTIPMPTLDKIQHLIEEIYLRSQYLREESKLAYQQAQDILLAELGLDDWQPQHKFTYTKKDFDMENAERIDAEYYQPKYEEIIKAITEYSGGADRLGNLCDTARGSLISDSFYTDSLGKVYIRGADFSGGTLSKNKAVYINKEFTERGETSVKEGDIVFSLIGSVGETALVTKEFSHSYISNNTGKISCTNGINPVVLQVLLKSIIGKMYFEKYKTQTAQPKISDKDTHNFVLPLLPEHKQLEIQEKVMESFELRERSKKLLENAKRAVEIAIEQDETTAIQFLNSET